MTAYKTTRYIDALNKLEYLVKSGRYKKNKIDLLVIRTNKNGFWCKQMLIKIFY